MENNILNGENSENLNQENSSFFDEKVSSSNSNEGYPKLAFKIFNKPWQKNRLDKICQINPANEKLPNEFYYIDLECVENGEITKELELISKETAPSRAQRLLEVNDMLYQTVRPYQKNNFLFDQSNDFPTVASTGYAQIRSEKNNIKYIYQMLHTDNFVTEAMKRSTGTGYPAICSSDLAEIEVYYPDIEEQNKIADFLSLIDKRIEKQRLLVENLKKYKRGLFEQIFKEYGTTSVKLNDLLIEKNEKSKINNEYEIISSTKQGLFLQAEYFNKQAASENTVGYKILRKNQVVFSPQNLWMGNINFNSDFEIGIVSPSYKIYDINPDYNAYFVGLILKSSKALKEYVLASEQGASIVRRNLNIEMFNEITLKFPDKNLQNKLANYMKSIEKHLSNQEKSLNNILKLKQGLLQQMFI